MKNSLIRDNKIPTNIVYPRKFKRIRYSVLLSKPTSPLSCRRVSMCLRTFQIGLTSSLATSSKARRRSRLAMSSITAPMRARWT